MKDRDSNIELLRIIATLLILIVHCNGWFLSQWGGVNGWYSDGYAIGVTRVLIQSIGALGVDLFILISGFYGIRPKLKSVVNLFTCIFFFYVGCYLWACYYLGSIEFSIGGLMENVLSFSYQNWFINCYLMLMLVSPVLNTFVENTNRKYTLIYTLVFMLFTYYFGHIRQNGYFGYNNGYSFVMMITVYMVGRCLNKYGIDAIRNIKTGWIFGMWVVTIILMAIIRSIASDTVLLLNYGSPINVFSSTLLFLLFYRIPPFKSKCINWVGASCLSVFIFHTCYPMV